MFAEIVVAVWFALVCAQLLRQWQKGALADEPVRVESPHHVRRYDRLDRS